MDDQILRTTIGIQVTNCCTPYVLICCRACQLGRNTETGPFLGMSYSYVNSVCVSGCIIGHHCIYIGFYIIYRMHFISKGSLQCLTALSCACRQPQICFSQWMFQELHRRYVNCTDKPAASVCRHGDERYRATYVSRWMIAAGWASLISEGDRPFCWFDNHNSDLFLLLLC